MSRLPDTPRQAAFFVMQHQIITQTPILLYRGLCYYNYLNQNAITARTLALCLVFSSVPFPPPCK